MFEPVRQRMTHYLLLALVTGGLCLPNLGGPSLWDIDEGNNAEAAREMLDADNWRLPTFNYQPRVDKPALLYWLQIFAYLRFGVNEFAARLPSALAAMATVLLTYELGRRMFGAAAGLLSGIVLATTIMFCAAGHFANPDALLTACTALTFLVFWHGIERRLHYGMLGGCMGLAVLAKGPVGLVLPAAIIGMFLLWTRQLNKLKDGRIALGILSFSLVALPWYLYVGAETRFEFVRRFIGVHNVGRFLSPMEGHGGPFYYYFVALAVGFAPWSAFLGPVSWYSCKREGVESTAAMAQRFLWCWIIGYVVFFTISRTKLPNYILPIYPALALLTGRFLDEWRSGRLSLPTWCLYACVGCFALVGVAASVGFAAASGTLPLALVPRHRLLPSLGVWALLGIVPLAGALVGGWFARRQLRTACIVSVALASALFIGPLAVWGGTSLDEYKAPRALGLAIARRQSEREIRIACFGYSQPSLVFYCKREVSSLAQQADALEFLRSPLQVFLVVPAELWNDIKKNVKDPHFVLARHHDLYKACEVVLVTNR